MPCAQCGEPFDYAEDEEEGGICESCRDLNQGFEQVHVDFDDELFVCSVCGEMGPDLEMDEEGVLTCSDCR